MQKNSVTGIDSITITLKNMTKEYNGRRIIDHLSYLFTAGSKTAVVAPSGAGKTTLLRILLGLEQADEGIIYYEKTLLASAVFQEDRLLEYTSPLENIRAVLPIGLFSEQKIYDELSNVGLSEAAYRRVSLLSGGMKRRTAIVRAVLMPGNLLIFDEPFKGLDEGLKQQVMNYVANRIQGRTFIFVTHDWREAEYYQADILNLCDR